MTPRIWMAAGLVSGVITGLVLVGLAVVFGPEPGIARATSSPTPGPAANVTAPPAPGTTPPATAGTAASGGASAGASASAAPTTTVMHIGQQAPVLAVPQVGGGTIDLGTLRGRPVWLIFLNTSCASCVQQLSLVNGYLSRYESSGLVVIGVDVRDEEGAVSNFAKRAAATFPFGLDLDGAAQREWEAASLPAHYWIDGSGVVRDATLGAVATERMATGLRQVLPGVDVHP